MTEKGLLPLHLPLSSPAGRTSLLLRRGLQLGTRPEDGRATLAAGARVPQLGAGQGGLGMKQNLYLYGIPCET